MLSTSPACDSHSPPVRIPSNTSSSLPYSSQPERTPNSRGISSIYPASATPPFLDLQNIFYPKPIKIAERTVHPAHHRVILPIQSWSSPSSSDPAGQHKPQDSPRKKKRTRIPKKSHQFTLLNALLAQVSPLSVTPSIPINTLFLINTFISRVIPLKL